MFKILLVDDSPLMRQFVARTLTMTGFDLELHEAGNGREAARMALSLRPDLIITDLHMPELNGEELLCVLDADELLRQTPILIVTADGERDRAEALTHRATVLACLRKPVRPEELREQLERLFLCEAARISGGQEPEDFVMNRMFRCLDDALGHVLNSMCFATPEYRGAGTVPTPLCAMASFYGDVEGEFRIALESRLAARLAADFLAVDLQSLEPAQATFFALELANILCGEMLAKAAPSKQYQISVPTEVPATGLEIYPHCFSVGGEDAVIGLDFGMAESMRPTAASGFRAS